MESKIVRYFLIAACIFTLAVDVVRPRAALGQQGVVRVAVLKDAEEFDFSIRGKYRIIDPQANKELDRGRRLQRVKVMMTRTAIMIGSKEYTAGRLRIIAKKDAAVYIKGRKRRYRGQMDIIRTKGNKLLVVNVLDLESYVKGVLYHEVPHRWPLNAIKAQAIAARTYVLYQAAENKEQKYDVTSDIYSQVYGGRSAERHRTNIATNRTRGQILTYNGKILPAYFHSNCGGHTEDASELWEHDLPPLAGVKCDFCAYAPNYQWKKNFRSGDIQDKLNAHGLKLGLIREIAVLDRTKTGRIKNLRITTRDEKVVTVSGVRFREIIGPNIIKSNNYSIEMKGYYFDVNGRGWGHGVGMCQWGAYKMSRKKYKYTSILNYYYPDAKITKMSEL